MDSILSALSKYVIKQPTLLERSCNPAPQCGKSGSLAVQMAILIIVQLSQTLTSSPNDRNETHQNLREQMETELRRLKDQRDMRERRIAHSEQRFKQRLEQLEQQLEQQRAEQRSFAAGLLLQLERAQAEQQRAILNPTEKELNAAEARLVPEVGKFHCAVAGNSGSGKSSLINALRGVSNRHSTAAAVGVTETTKTIKAYPDCGLDSPRNRFVWYDIPGAGTLTIPGSEYFNSQGLFVFDLIILVIDSRFTSQDIAILQNCVHYKIPSFIVRSKANQHIDNIMKDLEEDGWEGREDGLEDGTDGLEDREDGLEDEEDGLEDEEDGLEDEEDGLEDEDSEDDAESATYLAKAKEMLVIETRKNVRENLQNTKLDPDQKVYLVSADLVRQFATRVSQKGVVGELKNEEYLIDEGCLVADLLKAIRARRYDAHTADKST